MLYIFQIQQVDHGFELALLRFGGIVNDFLFSPITVTLQNVYTICVHAFW